MVEVLGRGVPTQGAQSGSRRRIDPTRLHTGYTTLCNVTLRSTLLQRGIPTAVEVAFEGEVDVVVGALYGGLVVGAKASVLSGKLRAVGQHVYLGLHNVVVAMPYVTNKEHESREVRDFTTCESLRGQKEARDLKESL